MDEIQISAERRKMQMEILMKDSDIKKNERTKIEIETALRDLKHKTNLLQAEIIAKENQLKKFQADGIQLQNEIIKLKHQMTSLGR
jgi:uncharacterized protein YlxW (UPF0749 family)